MTLKRAIIVLSILIFGAGVGEFCGCAKKEPSLSVYSGKGLKKPMEEIKSAFQQKYEVEVNIIYAGSGTLLKTIEDTRKGDIFVPGATHAIKKAADFVDNHQYVASHVPIIAVHKNNPKKIQSFDDLAKPGVRLTIGNANMCAIGRTADEIMAKCEQKEGLTNNVVIRSATVNELLNLLIKKEVDAAIIWKEMLRWPGSKNLKGIEIASDLNQIEEIRVAVLTMTEDKKTAQLFADFVTSEGKAIFNKRGFGEK